MSNRIPVLFQVRRLWTGIPAADAAAVIVVVGAAAVAAAAAGGRRSGLLLDGDEAGLGLPRRLSGHDHVHRDLTVLRLIDYVILLCIRLLRNLIEESG